MKIPQNSLRVSRQLRGSLDTWMGLSLTSSSISDRTDGTYLLINYQLWGLLVLRKINVLIDRLTVVVRLYNPAKIIGI